MTKGYIELHHSLFEEPIWTSSNLDQKAILLTLLLMTDDEKRPCMWNGELITLQPSQFVTTLDSLARQSAKGITVQIVETALKRFVEYGVLTVETANQNRLITILDSEFYRVG